MEHNEPQTNEAKMATPLQFSRRKLVDLIETRAGGKVKQLADKVGVTPQTIYNWRKGPHVPDAHQLMKLADALFVEIAEFYEPPDTVQ